MRYCLGDGSLRRAPSTFATEIEADRFLAIVELELHRGTWFDPEAGDVRLDVYAPRWLVERPVKLQPRTVEIDTRLLKLYILPAFGAKSLNRITSAAVRTWHASLRQRGVGQVSTAKAYRLLKAILNTAVEGGSLEPAGSADLPACDRGPYLAVDEIDRLAALGVGWGEIGAALGVSRQAARESWLRRHDHR